MAKVFEREVVALQSIDLLMQFEHFSDIVCRHHVVPRPKNDNLKALSVPFEVLLNPFFVGQVRALSRDPPDNSRQLIRYSENIFICNIIVGKY